MKKFLLVMGVIAVLVAAGWAVKAFTTVQAKARNSRLSSSMVERTRAKYAEALHRLM